MTAFSFSIAIDLVAALLITVLGSAVLLRQPSSSLRVSLLVVHFVVLLFVFGDLGAQFTGTIADKHVALSILYSGTIWIPVALWRLSYEFVEEHGRIPSWVPAWTFRAAFAFAATMWIGMLTNPLHGQFLTPAIGTRNTPHWLWLVSSAGGYAVTMGACGLCAWLALRRDVERRARHQAAILLTGMVVPLAANFVYNLTVWPWLLDPSVAALAVSVGCLATGVYGVGLFGLSPVSIRAALTSDPSAVLLVNRAGRLVFENASAARLLIHAPLGRGFSVLERLASRLRTAEANERVSENELWGLVGEDAKKRGGTLYQLADREPDDEQWLFVSAMPVSSLWRENAAYCFRVQDVTRLRQSERDRMYLEERARPREEAGRATAPVDRVTVRARTPGWPSELLLRLRNSADPDDSEGPSFAEIDRLLEEIESDPVLRQELERMEPLQVWLKFQRVLSPD